MYRQVLFHVVIVVVVATALLVILVCLAFWMLVIIDAKNRGLTNANVLR